MANAVDGEQGEKEMPYDPALGFPRVVAELLYVEPEVALTWLIDVLGFVPRLRFDDRRGRLQHAELELGGRVLMLGHRASLPDAAPTWLQAHFPSTNSRALLERARARGQEPLRVWGEAARPSFLLSDCEGHVLSLSPHSALAR